jgi:flagellin
MSLRINTNVTAINALGNLERTSGNVATSIERLSSGLRINRASDDPAGLIISEGLRSQIDGMNQAIANAQDANNLIKTAEGGLAEINSLLRSIRTLAVHAANAGVNDSTAVQADQTQIASALASIDRIATQTQFGTKKLLDGTSGVSATVIDTANVKGAFIGGVFNNQATLSGPVTVSVTTVATRAEAFQAAGATYASQSSLISSVNGGTTGSGGTVVINGHSITVSGSDTVQTLINKVNALTSVTGVSAFFSSADGSGAIALRQENYGANFRIVSNESSDLILGSANPANVAGVNAVASVTALVNVNNVTTASTATFTGGQGAGESGLKLTDSYGNSILLTEAGNSSGARNVATITAASLQFQVGGNSGQQVSTNLGNVQTTRLGTTAVSGVSSLAAIDVTTVSGASDAIRVVDQAIQQISTLRAQLGAFQKNTLASTIRYLGVGVENLSASESQIRDTQVAQEVTSLTKNQILQQAGASVLAQANAAPQLVLGLLR